MILWNAENSVLPRDIAQVIRRRNIASRVQIIQAGANHVDQVRTEGVGVTQGALLCKGGLGSLLEAAAVGNPTENTWNKLRIVDPAKPEKYLVLLAEVEVHAGIERVLVLKQLWRIREVSKER